jgi:hypothetical protein
VCVLLERDWASSYCPCKPGANRFSLPAAPLCPFIRHVYSSRDVRALANVGSLRDFEKFLRACALRSTNLLNKADLARDVGTAPSTANQWLSMLETSGQAVLLEPWFSNRTKSIVTSPKLYIADTGLLCALLNIRSEEALRQSPRRGMGTPGTGQEVYPQYGVRSARFSKLHVPSPGGSNSLRENSAFYQGREFSAASKALA